MIRPGPEKHGVWPNLSLDNALLILEMKAVRSRSSRSLVHEAADSLKIEGAHEDTYRLSSNYLVGADGGKK